VIARRRARRQLDGGDRRRPLRPSRTSHHRRGAEAAQHVAAQAGTDPQLTAPGARSIAIVHPVTAHGKGRTRRLIVVPHETISADSIRQSRWRVTVAKAERRHDGWVVSRWEPQP
jgi:hypothetical protein